MDVSSINTLLLDIREGLTTSTFLQNMEKRISVLNSDKDNEPKVYSKNSFMNKYYGVKTFGISYDNNFSKEIVTNSIDAGFTPLDAIKMNRGMQAYGLESLTSKNGVELLSKHFHVI